MPTYDFGNGPVSAHQHLNGGGWVADTAYVSDSVLIGPNALVYDMASVTDIAMIYDTAKVFGKARINNCVRVYGSAIVFGNTILSGASMIYGTAIVNTTPLRISRSDGYDFISVYCADGYHRIIAGCRYFTFEEAYNHWNSTHKHYDETVAILDRLMKKTIMSPYIPLNKKN